MKQEAGKDNGFETVIKEYLAEAKERLLTELEGTRGAIRLVADDKSRDLMRTLDIGFSKEERQFLSDTIVQSMHQSFCYGYGIGKMEGSTNKKVYL
ncbi:MAG: hypothetical protein PHV32_13300 [Eubacteriales bacterium]|nr:hypothetical protein [Eubacteriales bacterium]